MKTLKVLRQRPALFFRLSGIGVSDFDDLVKQTYPLWLKSERKRLSRADEKIQYFIRYSLQGRPSKHDR